MKDYIELLDENDKTIIGEIVAKVEKNNKKYLIYRVGNELFAAKYNLDAENEYVDLDNNLTEEEYKLLEGVINNDNK